MFYAASEIVFWILLAAIAGGGIGYGFSEARSLRLDKRLTQGRADAPMERELAIAWDTIEDLNKRLQVAHETIRGSNELLDDAIEGTESAVAAASNEPVAAADTEDTDDTDVVGARLSARVASASIGNQAGSADPGG